MTAVVSAKPLKRSVEEQDDNDQNQCALTASRSNSADSNSAVIIEFPVPSTEPLVMASPPCFAFHQVRLLRQDLSAPAEQSELRDQSLPTGGYSRESFPPRRQFTPGAESDTDEDDEVDSLQQDKFVQRKPSLDAVRVIDKRPAISGRRLLVKPPLGRV